MFDEMNASIQEDVVKWLMALTPEQTGIQRKRVSKETSHAQKNMSSEQKTVIKGKKIGRNDPCPCGSGKKYKKCCGKDLQEDAMETVYDLRESVKKLNENLKTLEVSL